MKRLFFLAMLLLLIPVKASAFSEHGKVGFWTVYSYPADDGSHSHCGAEKNKGQDSLTLIYPTDNAKIVPGAINLVYLDLGLSAQLESGAQYNVELFIDDKYVTSVDAEATAIPGEGMTALVMRLLDLETESLLIRGNTLTIDIGRKYRFSLAGSAAALAEVDRCNKLELAKQNSRPSLSNRSDSVAARRIDEPQPGRSNNTVTGPRDEFDELAVTLGVNADEPNTIFLTAEELRAENYEDSVLSVYENDDVGAYGIMLEDDYSEDRRRQSMVDNFLNDCLEDGSTPMPNLPSSETLDKYRRVTQIVLCLDRSSSVHVAQYTTSFYEPGGEQSISLVEVMRVEGEPESVKTAWLQNADAF